MVKAKGRTQQKGMLLLLFFAWPIITSMDASLNMLAIVGFISKLLLVSTWLAVGSLGNILLVSISFSIGFFFLFELFYGDFRFGFFN